MNRKLKWAIIAFVAFFAIWGVTFLLNHKDDASSELESQIASNEDSTTALESTQAVENLPSATVLSLRERMEQLTSVAFDGRYPGTEGGRLTEAYLVSEMRQIGLASPSFAENYLMEFELILPVHKQLSTLVLETGEAKLAFEYGEDFVPFVTRDFAVAEGAFSGKVSVIDDPFKLVDFDYYGHPEIVLYKESAFSGIGYESLFAQILEAPNRPKVILYESAQQNSGHFVLSPYSRRAGVNDNEGGLFIYKVSSEAFAMIAANPEAQLSGTVDAVMETITANNVVGMIDGSGDEGVIITAHFDHLGNNLDGTYNPGALDNASGVAAMLAVAEQLVTNPNPEFDYYFIAFNGEEEGLFGSGAFAAEGVLSPAQFHMINLDMVGASGDVKLEIASTSEQSLPYQDVVFAEALEAGLDVIKTDKGSSDHVPMEATGFKAVSLTELDKRYYHTPKDVTDDAVNLEKMEKVVTFVLGFLLERLSTLP